MSIAPTVSQCGPVLPIDWASLAILVGAVQLCSRVRPEAERAAEAEREFAVEKRVEEIAVTCLVTANATAPTTS